MSKNKSCNMDEKIIKTTDTPWGKIHMLPSIQQGTDEDIKKLCNILSKIVIKNQLEKQSKLKD